MKNNKSIDVCWPSSSQSKLYSLFYILISVDWSITSWKVDHNHLSYVPGTLSFLITFRNYKKKSTQQTNKPLPGAMVARPESSLAWSSSEREVELSSEEKWQRVHPAVDHLQHQQQQQHDYEQQGQGVDDLQHQGGEKGA